MSRRRRASHLADGAALAAEAARIGFEANMVIAMRMMGFAGWWATSPSEAERMVAEKRRAFTEAAFAAGRAAAKGAGPAAVTKAAMKPIRRKTKANAKRLARRGPGRPRAK
ncbi:MAG: hypothetical protein AAGF90_08800 [Pseudomonadota bacterium]